MNKYLMMDFFLLDTLQVTIFQEYIADSLAGSHCYGFNTSYLLIFHT